MTGNKTIDKYLTYVYAFLGIAFVITLIFVANEPSHSSSTISIEEQTKRAYCRSRTNDYQKCSWSIIENRCTCKLR